MGTKRMMLAALAAVNLLMSTAQQQFWNSLPGGNVINSTEYLGAAANSTVPLRFTTIPNLRQEWRTDNIRRMWLMGTDTMMIIGSYDSLDLSGH